MTTTPPPPNSGTETPMTDAEAEYTGANIDQVAAMTALARTLERRVNRLKGLLERVSFCIDHPESTHWQVLQQAIDAEGKE